MSEILKKQWRNSMNLGELIVKARNIGDRFASWFLIDTNVDSIELLGDDMEGYRIKVKLKQEPINEEELDKLAEEYIQGFDYAIEISPNLLSLKKDRALAKSVFKAVYRKAMER